MAETAIIGLMAAGAVMSAVGSIQQGQSQGAAADYNAAVNRNNALTASRVGAAQAEQQRAQSAQAMGEQAAATAQAGIGFGGSAADIRRQSYTNAALDQLNTRYASDLQSQSYMQQANLEDYQGRQARTAGYIGAGSAILSGAGNYAGTTGGYGRMRGLFGP